MRKLIATLSVVILGILFFYSYHEWANTSPGQNVVAMNEYVKQALDFKKTQQNTISQLTILVLGGLWGLSFTGPRKLTHKYPSIWVVFSAANLAFLSSFILYLKGNEYLIETLFKAQNIDLQDQSISLYSETQGLFFMTGLLFSITFAILYCCSSEAKA